MLTIAELETMMMAGLKTLGENMVSATEADAEALLRRNTLTISLCAWSMGDDFIAADFSGLFVSST